MFNDLYFSKETQKYYFLGVEPCCNCFKLIDNFIFIMRVYNNKEKKIFYVCNNCIKKKIKLPFVYNEKITALIVDEIPKDAFPVFDIPPSVQDSNRFDESINYHKSIAGEKVIDKTIQSHNTNFMIDDKVKSQEQLKSERKDLKLLNSDFEIDEYIDSLRKSTPLNNRFELEDKKDKERLKLK